MSTTPVPPRPSSLPEASGPTADGSATGTSTGVVVGLDIGGSKTHGALWRDGALVAEAKAGSANVQNVTPAEAARNLEKLFRDLAPAGDAGTIGRVVAGSGGVDTAADAERLRALIAPHAPSAAVDVIHDTRLILAAGRRCPHRHRRDRRHRLGGLGRRRRRP
ncbi:hypothetical protein MN0502_23630 [Arthrobacter sp. MN05-02]|nr:hypothetical protein MN0502_23630 [Arthrobacter sp. MN05-02]